MPSIASLVEVRYLHKDLSGDDVATLQSALAAAGYSLLPDGKFGSITELAVTEFQKSAGLEADGIVGRATARALDARTPAEPPVTGNSICVDLMYGLGDASTSAGMDVLAAALRALSPRLIVAPTVSWTARDELAKRIRLRNARRNMLFGNSMGANAIPMVTNGCPGISFDLIGGYDPTIWWTCPAFGGNVAHGINYHGVNWINPIGHALYTPAFAGQIEVVNTSTIHQNVDDDLALHRHTLDVVRQRVLAS